MFPVKHENIEHTEEPHERQRANRSAPGKWPATDACLEPFFRTTYMTVLCCPAMSYEGKMSKYGNMGNVRCV